MHGTIKSHDEGLHKYDVTKEKFIACIIGIRVLYFMRLFYEFI